VLSTLNILTSVLFFPFGGTSEYRKSLSFWRHGFASLCRSLGTNWYFYKVYHTTTIHGTRETTHPECTISHHFDSALDLRPPPPGNVPVALTPMTTILTAGRRCISAVAVGSQVWQPVCYAERLRCVAVDTADLVDAGLVLAGLYVVSNCRLVQRRIRRRTQRHLIQHLHADSTHTSCQRISTKAAPHILFLLFSLYLCFPLFSCWFCAVE